MVKYRTPILRGLSVASLAAALLLAGLAGLLVVLRRPAAFQRPAERWPYVVFSIGMLLTAAGSAYYHLAPDNERLFRGRLPMTVAFMLWRRDLLWPTQPR